MPRHKRVYTEWLHYIGLKNRQDESVVLEIRIVASLWGIVTVRVFSGVLVMFHFLTRVLVIWWCSFCEHSQSYSLMIWIILCIYYRKNKILWNGSKITGCLWWKSRCLTHLLYNKEFGRSFFLVPRRESLNPWNSPSDRKCLCSSWLAS